MIDHIDTAENRAPGAPDTPGRGSFVQSAYIDHAKDSVAKVATTLIKQANAKFLTDTKAATLTDDPFSLSADLFGLRYHNIRAAVDPNGFLVFYLGFGESEP